MRLQVEPSEIFIEVDGVRCRVWNGVAESGEQVFVFVARVAVPNDARSGIVFGQELIECQAPHQRPETAVEILRRYGQHYNGCISESKTTCSCGFRDALSQAEERARNHTPRAAERSTEK